MRKGSLGCSLDILLRKKLMKMVPLSGLLHPKTPLVTELSRMILWEWRRPTKNYCLPMHQGHYKRCSWNCSGCLQTAEMLVLSRWKTNSNSSIGILFLFVYALLLLYLSLFLCLPVFLDRLGNVLLHCGEQCAYMGFEMQWTENIVRLFFFKYFIWATKIPSLF